MRYLVALFVVFMTFGAVAQEVSIDTLWYINGETELIHSYTFTEDKKYMSYFNEKGKRKECECFYIFSINKADGTKQIIYDPLTTDEENPLSVSDMQNLVVGNHFAKEEYNATLFFIEGLVVGVVSPWVVSATTLNPFFSVLIPASNSGVVGLTNPCERKIIERYPEKSKNDYFMEGYKKTAKKKRVLNTITGGAIGLISSIVVYFIVN